MASRDSRDANEQRGVARASSVASPADPYAADAAPWGLFALDDDTFSAVIAAVRLGAASNMAALARCCVTTAAALANDLRQRKMHAMQVLRTRLGWSAQGVAMGAEILMSTNQCLSDSDMLLVCCLLFGDRTDVVHCDDEPRIAPLLSHLNLGSNKIGDRGLLGLIDAASRWPRERLAILALSSNLIGDNGALALARAIEKGVAFPALRMYARSRTQPAAAESTRTDWCCSAALRLSMGGNAISAEGERALRDACQAKNINARGLGVLRGAPVVRAPKQGSWVVVVEVDSADSSRSSVGLTVGGPSSDFEAEARPAPAAHQPALSTVT